MGIRVKSGGGLLGVYVRKENGGYWKKRYICNE